jgi:hypothetical protein
MDYKLLVGYGYHCRIVTAPLEKGTDGIQLG